MSIKEANSTATTNASSLFNPVRRNLAGISRVYGRWGSGFLLKGNWRNDSVQFIRRYQLERYIVERRTREANATWTNQSAMTRNSFGCT
ncbi:hypothetical protein OUZ56_004621 [Daphnia magna]|uniref:Uncharacterized protein n=1 Tax=Daphnia magna TaxID=35525 RepID=A0ABQ9YQB7_9CRUS|nr:hypothetical protein OUZ56_004621 [Daphnia magna]